MFVLKKGLLVSLAALMTFLIESIFVVKGEVRFKFDSLIVS